MKEKIARAMCEKQDPELNCKDCVRELVCAPIIDRLLALIEQENTGMREALEAAESIVNDSTDSRAAKCLAKIDAVLEGK
jgi:hypothetical protein